MALSKPRTSSHNLEIERDRYTRLQLNVDQRICMSCNVLEDEEHFLLHWQDNWVERELFVSVLKNSSYFFNQSSSEQFVCLMRCPDPQIVAWFGKFIHHSYLNRDIIRYNARTCWRQGIVFLCVFFSSLAAAFDDMQCRQWGRCCRFLTNGDLSSRVCIYQFFTRSMFQYADMLSIVAFKTLIE